MPSVEGVEATREELAVSCYLAKGCSENLIADMVGRAAAFKNEMTG